jgi:hypothetical protein
MKMALSGVSLNAATALGPGSAVVFDTPKTGVSFQIVPAGNSTFVVGLEGSLDGINFTNIGETSPAGSASQIITYNSGAIIAARANLISISGGTNPTVTVIIAAAAD